MTVRLCAGLALWLAAGACDARAGDALTRVGDSAGVRVVESLGPAWGEGEGWRVSPEPARVLGGDAAPDAVLMDVVGAAQLADGRVVVADAASGELRYFGSEGEVVLRVGLGALPGLETVGSLARLPADSLIVFDPGQGRLAVLDATGAVVGQVTLERAAGVGFDRVAAFADGTLVVRTSWRASGLPDAAGVLRAPLDFLRYRRDGRLLNPVAEGLGPAVASVPLGPARTLVSAPLGAVTVHGVHGDALYVGTGDAFDLRVHAPSGVLEERLRLPRVDLSATAEEVIEARRERRGTMRGNPTAEALLARIEQEVPDPERRPAYGELVIDRLGHVWIGEYPWGGAGGTPPRSARRWTILAPDGVWLGDLELPPGLRLLEVGADYLLGVVTDVDGRQRVARHSLARSEEGAR